MHCTQAKGMWQLTSWPMGMAERGSVLPGLIVLAGPVLIWSPGRTPCGANTYEKPLKSPPGDPAFDLQLKTGTLGKRSTFLQEVAPCVVYELSEVLVVFRQQSVSCRLKS